MTVSNSPEDKPLANAVLVERKGPILLVTLNRPEAMNAINADVSRGLNAAVNLLDNDSTLAVGVLTGIGRGFCAGMDLKAFSRNEDIGPFNVFLFTDPRSHSSPQSKASHSRVVWRWH